MDETWSDLENDKDDIAASGGSVQYRLPVWGKNLTDTLCFNHIQAFGIGSTIGYMSNPRQVGVTLGVDF